MCAVYKTVSVAIEKGDVLPEDISSIDISTAMHALIAVDKNGTPLTRSIIWADNRSTKQSEKLLQQMNGHDIYRRTGTLIHPMSPLSKLLWMKEEEPELYKSAYKFISIKEYVIYQLFSRYVVDYSIASATGLFNLETLNWDEAVLTMLQMSSEQLSTPVPTTYILSGMKPELAQKMGIHEDTPIVIGASDGVLANVGVGVISPGSTAITIGTSGAVRTISSSVNTDEKGRTFCYALTDEHWVIGGPTNNGGILLRWLRDEFGSPEQEVARKLGIDPYDLLIKYAESVPAGAGGLLFLPFYLENVHLIGMQMLVVHSLELIFSINENILYVQSWKGFV